MLATAAFCNGTWRSLTSHLRDTEEEVVEKEVAVGPVAPLKEEEEILEAQMIQIRIQSQT